LAGQSDAVVPRTRVGCGTADTGRDAYETRIGEKGKDRERERERERERGAGGGGKEESS